MTPFVVLPLPLGPRGPFGGSRNLKEAVRRARNRLTKRYGADGWQVECISEPGAVRPASEELVRLHRDRAELKSRVLALRLDSHPLIQIAQDGSFLTRPTNLDTLVLAHGTRADIVVQARDTGRFALSAAPYDRGRMMGGATGDTGPVTLATMVTSGSPGTVTPLPAALPAETLATAPVTRTRRTIFQMGTGGGMGMAGGMAVAIDGRTFDPTRDDQTIVFGSTEEWTVANTSPLAHPFHIHVWPFTVIAASDGRVLTGTPQDVVLIPPRGWVQLRIPFTGFAGRSVYHCHILDHEDAGMMATVAVA